MIRQVAAPNANKLKQYIVIVRNPAEFCTLLPLKV